MRMSIDGTVDDQISAQGDENYSFSDADAGKLPTPHPNPSSRVVSHSDPTDRMKGDDPDANNQSEQYPRDEPPQDFEYMKEPSPLASDADELGLKSLDNNIYHGWFVGR